MYRCERCGSPVDPVKAQARYAASTKYPLAGCGECVCGDLIEKTTMDRIMEERNAPRSVNALAEAFRKAKRVK